METDRDFARHEFGKRLEGAWIHRRYCTLPLSAKRVAELIYAEGPPPTADEVYKLADALGVDAQVLAGKLLTLPPRLALEETDGA
jgi:hypothetical protein